MWLVFTPTESFDAKCFGIVWSVFGGQSSYSCCSCCFCFNSNVVSPRFCFSPSPGNVNCSNCQVRCLLTYFFILLIHFFSPYDLYLFVELVSIEMFATKLAVMTYERYSRLSARSPKSNLLENLSN